MQESSSVMISHKLGRLWIAIVFVVIAAAWIATPFITLNSTGSLEKAGTFGDLYGSINSLFSGFAFAGIVVTILLQRSELKLQREELKFTREELKRAAAAQEQSGDKLAVQAEVMKVSAHLNGLSTLIQSTSAQIEFLRSRGAETSNTGREKIEELARKRDSDIEELESLMHGIRCSAEYPYA